MQVDPNERPRSSYLVCGQINLDKSDVYQRDFLSYIHALSAKFRLTAYGDIGPGMEIFGYISRSKRQENLLPLQKHANTHRRKSRGKPQPYNVRTCQARSKRQQQLLDLAKSSIPDLHAGLQPSIWNCGPEWVRLYNLYLSLAL